MFFETFGQLPCSVWRPARSILSSRTKRSDLFLDFIIWRPDSQLACSARTPARSIPSSRAKRGDLPLVFIRWVKQSVGRASLEALCATSHGNLGLLPIRHQPNMTIRNSLNGGLRAHHAHSSHHEKCPQPRPTKNAPPFYRHRERSFLVIASFFCACAREAGY